MKDGDPRKADQRFWFKEQQTRRNGMTRMESKRKGSGKDEHGLEVGDPRE